MTVKAHSDGIVESAPAAQPAAPFAAEAKRRDNGVIDALIEEARLDESKGELAAAAWHLDVAVAMAPEDVAAHRARARIAQTMGALDVAEFHARQALQYRPGDGESTIILARIASAAGHDAEAMALLVSIGPGEEGYRQGLVQAGRNLLAQGRPLEAIGEFAEAIALGGTDPAAMRGLAEACEAAGGLQAALGHWRRYLAVAPQDAAAAAHVARLAAWAPPSQPSVAPLVDASLRDWRGSLAGEVGGAGISPTTAISLRSLDSSGPPLGYAVVEPQEERPGDLPSFALRLELPAGGAEVQIGLDPRAHAALTRGIAMVQAARAETEGATALEIWLVGPGVARQLATFRLGRWPRLLPFTLCLDAAEALVLARAGGGLGLALRLFGPGVVIVRAPRFQAGLRAPTPQPTGFEDPVLSSARFARLVG